MRDAFERTFFLSQFSCFQMHNLYDSDMEVQLMQALISRDIKLAKILIEGGVNVNFKQSTGETPLMVACYLQIEEKKKVDIVKCILQHSVDIHTTDTTGRTALMYAIRSGSVSTVQLLKSHGLTEAVSSKINLCKATEMQIWRSFEV